ncbi:MAG: hypothetical protein FWC71_06620 [Defluviitaleaceae bacterium]|nr:hypothetical protein [Defluviitaleaceae bacterium]
MNNLIRGILIASVFSTMFYFTDLQMTCEGENGVYCCTGLMCADGNDRNEINDFIMQLLDDEWVIVEVSYVDDEYFYFERRSTMICGCPAHNPISERVRLTLPVGSASVCYQSAYVIVVSCFFCGSVIHAAWSSDIQNHPHRFDSFFNGSRACSRCGVLG